MMGEKTDEKNHESTFLLQVTCPNEWENKINEKVKNRNYLSRAEYFRELLRKDLFGDKNE